MRCGRVASATRMLRLVLASVARALLPRAARGHLTRTDMRRGTRLSSMARVVPAPSDLTPKPPSGAHWLHEIKHDGFRVIVRKDGARVRLYSRPGNDLTERFSLIVEALA